MQFLAWETRSWCKVTLATCIPAGCFTYGWRPGPGLHLVTRDRFLGSFTEVATPSKEVCVSVTRIPCPPLLSLHCYVVLYVLQELCNCNYIGFPFILVGILRMKRMKRMKKNEKESRRGRISHPTGCCSLPKKNLLRAKARHEVLCAHVKIHSL